MNETVFFMNNFTFKMTVYRLICFIDWNSIMDYYWILETIDYRWFIDIFKISFYLTLNSESASQKTSVKIIFNRIELDKKQFHIEASWKMSKPSRNIFDSSSKLAILNFLNLTPDSLSNVSDPKNHCRCWFLAWDLLIYLVEFKIFQIWRQIRMSWPRKTSKTYF